MHTKDEETKTKPNAPKWAGRPQEKTGEIRYIEYWGRTDTDWTDWTGDGRTDWDGLGRTDGRTIYSILGRTDGRGDFYEKMSMI